MYNMNNNSIEVQRQEGLKRRWHDSFYTRLLTSPNTSTTTHAASSSPLIMGKPPPILQPGRLDGGDLVPNVVPSVTVVLEGRSICQRINLHSHANYQSLAKALRQMFANTLNFQQNEDNLEGKELDLSTAIPGYLVAYEDLENDLLLAGDLNWKDFIRVAKRIRILPVKSKSKKQNSTKP